MVTIQKIAECAGVSQMTVSNALNGRIKGARQDAVARAERIRLLAKQMGYKPHAAARSMTDGRTRTIAVAIRDERFGYDALLGINRVLEGAGYLLALVPMDDIVAGEQPVSRLFRERLADGLAVLSCSNQDLKRIDERLPDLTDKTIYVDTNCYLPTGCLRRDEKAAGQTAAKHLAALGYTQLVFVDRPDDVETYCFHERRVGVSAECERLNIDYRRAVIPWFRNGKRDAGAVAALAEQTDFTRTAVLSTDASLARVVVTHWMQRRLAPGLDYALACCDETVEESLLWPQLSRVSFDRGVMGEQAGRMLLTMLNENQTPRSHKLAGDWIAGETAVDVRSLMR